MREERKEKKYRERETQNDFKQQDKEIRSYQKKLKNNNKIQSTT